MSRTIGTDLARERAEPLSVLNLTTSADAVFYRLQVESLEERGVECETLAVPGEADGRNEDVNRSPVDYVRFFPKVWRELARRDYDLVHANYGLTAPHALAQSKVPVVLSLWGTDVYGPFGWVSKLSSPRCDAVVVMSDPLGREIPADYTVIPHGIDLDQFEPMPRGAARRALDWTSRGHHVLFPAPVAREEKDFPRARRVVRCARDRLSDPVVLHTPDGDVSHERMPVWMNAADAMLLTSRHEGFPNTVKEALACNLPVVSTDVGSVGERLAPVSQCVVGRTDAELVDGLVRVLQSGGRSDGRETVADLDHRRVAERLEAVYRRVLGESGKTSGSRPPAGPSGSD
jgi:glycosyltransferase involved in cell wall biosynthesis